MTERQQHQWYFRVDDIEYGPLTARSLYDLARAGRIRPDTPIRRDDMTETVPARRVRGLTDRPDDAKAEGPRPVTDASGAPGVPGEGSRLPEVDLTPVSRPATEPSLPEIELSPVGVDGAAASSGFRDPSLLVSWVEICLWAWIAFSVICIATNAVSYQILTDIKTGAFATAALAEAASDAMDRRDLFLAVVGLCLTVTTTVIVLRWIHRAGFNARALGAESMRYSPAWAVGSYFVPVVNLWKPYQAMREIWKASSNPSAWQAEPTGALLRTWWFLWLFTTVVDCSFFYFLMKSGETTEDLIAQNAFETVADIVAIPLAVIFIALVKKIHNMQMAHAPVRP